MSTPERKSFGASGGLAAEVLLEAGTEIGDIPVKARGYWEQVWIRFRRDKVAIVGGIFIIFLFLVAFIGAPIAAAILGHGPNDLYYTGVDPNTLLPVGPWTHIQDLKHPGHTTLLILGAYRETELSHGAQRRA